MSTARPTLAATSRDITGKAVAGLRRQGRLPAVVFGHGVDSASVSVDAHEFELLRRRAGPNALVDLSIDGHKATAVLVHGVQVHAVTRRPLHADLFVVRMSEELSVDVPLVAVGLSPAVELHGSTLLHALEHVRVRALPDHLPRSIEYSIESLTEVDDAIHVGDLAIPADVHLLTDPGEIVAKILHSRVEEVAPVVEPAPAVSEPSEPEAPAS